MEHDKILTNIIFQLQDVQCKTLSLDILAKIFSQYKEFVQIL